jgi:hypothetical protein
MGRMGRMDVGRVEHTRHTGLQHGRGMDEKGMESLVRPIKIQNRAGGINYH